ncbi:hypothetical protein DEV91_106120 [Phyllobacterium brassicacearum]|nr:hypothetical protein DEV91_106120 [Phyllobacterium brassicacearum]
MAKVNDCFRGQSQRTPDVAGRLRMTLSDQLNRPNAFRSWFTVTYCCVAKFSERLSELAKGHLR